MDATITKTNAMTQYRLKAQDLEGLTFVRKPSTTPGQQDMQLYQERDVERRAWERHGGPQGFEAYLEKLYQRHLKSKHANSPFTQPGQYSFGRKAQSIVEARTSSAYKRLSATKTRVEQSMQPWLFDAVRKALDRNEIETYELSCGYVPAESPRQEEKPYLLAEKFPRTYPPRPPQPLPSSPSVDAVRAILAEAATPPKPSEPQWGRDLPGLEFHSNCWPEQEEWYEWSREYMERLFSALIRVIEELRTGDEGWKGIRWEVYDKYAETFKKSIYYDSREEKWGDDAAHWLDGQFTTKGIALDVTGRRCCPAGERYNSILPYLHPNGGMSVGWAQ